MRTGREGNRRIVVSWSGCDVWSARHERCGRRAAGTPLRTTQRDGDASRTHAAAAHLPRVRRAFAGPGFSALLNGPPGPGLHNTNSADLGFALRAARMICVSAVGFLLTFVRFHVTETQVSSHTIERVRSETLVSGSTRCQQVNNNNRDKKTSQQQ